MEAGRAGESKKALASLSAYYFGFQPEPPADPAVHEWPQPADTENVWEQILAERARKIEVTGEPIPPDEAPAPNAPSETTPPDPSRGETPATMTKRQRKILTLGLVAFVASAILPPWRDHGGNLGPYALLTNGKTDRLDVHRLLVEWIIIVAVTGVLMLLAAKGKAE